MTPEKLAARFIKPGKTARMTREKLASILRIAMDMAVDQDRHARMSPLQRGAYQQIRKWIRSINEGA